MLRLILGEDPEVAGADDVAEAGRLEGGQEQFTNFNYIYLSINHTLVCIAYYLYSSID